MKLMENEQIKQIEGFPQYFITSFGRVWSNISNKWLIPTKSKTGNHIRLYVSLGRGNKRYIHRLVAKAFIPNPNNLPEVDHKDTNGENNNVENLRWVTHYDNLQNELSKEHIKRNSGYYVEIKEISTGRLFRGYEQASQYAGVSRATIINHTQNKVKNPKWELTGKRFKEISEKGLTAD